MNNTSTTKEQRLEIVNQIIKEIAGRGRRFFHSKGNIAELFIKNGKVYYKCECVSEHKPVHEICLSVPDYKDLKGWYHGGTLRGLVLDFRDYIKTGNYANHNNGYGGLYCPHWGYPEDDMKAIQEKAIELGYLIRYQKP